MRRVALAGLCLTGITFLGGCGGYATPTPDGGMALSAIKSERSAQTDWGVQDTLRTSPLAELPTAIAVVRVEGSPYCAPRTGAESATFRVVTTRDVEKPELLAKLDALPMVKGIAPLTSIMLPEYPSETDLRRAAATLHADMLLMYTLQTKIRVDDKLLPLSVVTLGLSPTQVVSSNCTASALLVDTRNGYVYGTMEASGLSDQPSSAWTCDAATNAARDRSEQAAFAKLTDRMSTTWGDIVKQVQAAGPASAAAAGKGQPAAAAN